MADPVGCFVKWSDVNAGIMEMERLVYVWVEPWGSFRWFNGPWRFATVVEQLGRAEFRLLGAVAEAW